MILISTEIVIHDTQIYMRMKLIFEEKVHQIHSTVHLALRISEQARTPVLKELTPSQPVLFVYLFTQYLLSMGRGGIIRIIVGGPLSYKGLVDNASPPRR